MKNSWFYSQDDKTYGPFPTDTLKQMATAGVISEETLVSGGEGEEWKRFGEVDFYEGTIMQGDNFIANMAGRVTRASGLEQIQGFSFRELFSQVFKHHSEEDIEEHFAAGTKTTTPPLSAVSSQWPTPWVFVRLLGTILLLALIFYYACQRFNNPKLIPGLIFVGCFSNVLRNISFYRVLVLMFLGGVMGMLFSLFGFEYLASILELGDWLGLMSAGIIEEPGKLLAVAYMARKWKGRKWMLNGLLCGAAVGTGFSAFESAGYVFQGGGTQLMVMRAILSPFTHTVWTAVTTAALWRVMSDPTAKWSFLKWRFLRIFFIVVGLHMLWNSPIILPLVGNELGFFIPRIFVGLIGWMLVFALIQSGLKEIRNAKAEMNIATV